MRRKLGLPTLTFNDLRHAAISLLGAQGVPLQVAMEIAGHSQVATTAQISATVSDEMRTAASAMDRVFTVAR
ncbi:MAG: tyrosine-type recombinase/integrase [Chloroflexota bacterium]|nr:tyrosine-type recombinase/integrase [Chloroflexota bacterium]